MCTGDHHYKFTDRNGEEFEVAITRPITLESIKLEHERKPDTRPWTVSVVHRHTTIVTVDGDPVQQRILQFVSDLSAQIQAKDKPGKDDEFWLGNLDTLIDDLRSRQLKK